MGSGKEAVFSCPCEQRAISPRRHLLQTSRRSAGARRFLEDRPEQGQPFLVVPIWKSTQPVFMPGFWAGHWPVCSPQTQGEAAQALLFPQSRIWEEEGNILYLSSHSGGISKKLNWEIEMTVIFGGNNCAVICLPEEDNMGRAGSQVRGEPGFPCGPESGSTSGKPRPYTMGSTFTWKSRLMLMQSCPGDEVTSGLLAPLGWL